jgi:acyl-coenzyme A synthetase/AMP-(fatty) acid ligase
MYVIFTSGSTGRPKGVQIPHRAVVNFLNSMRREPGLVSDDVVLAVTTLSFDIAGLEIFLPLVTGATVVISSRESARDGSLLRREFERNGVSVMQATPITWRSLLEAGWHGSSSLKILCGGEALPVELANELLPCCAELWNMYGPTETTIWSTCHRITQLNQPVRIGRPIDNTQVYIVNEQMQLQPIGVVGELLIGGAGVAKGYHQRPELTAEKFVTDKFTGRTGMKLYRTGDLARWRPDGTIECLGRLDHQVKIRGFRIELGEVEDALSCHAAVRECVVIAREESPGQKRLVGYVSIRIDPDQIPTPATHANLPAELNNYLRTRLPEYMAPSTILVLDSLPRTPNGKIDRQALPAPASPGAILAREFVAPRNEREKMLAEIWQQVLGLERVSVQDSFFELGGDSLSSFRVANRANQNGLQLSVRMFFEHRTIEKIVKSLEDEGVTAGGSAIVPAVTRISRDAHRRKLTAHLS